ncbi:MAG: Do family serine endopeptidase [Acidobacteriia bacterium]|nr:Do family serine endopeptidase [Terriglobia bacterium]
MNRKWTFPLLLAVVGVSIIFGMVLGGRLNAPQIALAARDVPTAGLGSAAEPPMGAAGSTDFADIVERSIPAVVGITSTSVKKGGGDTEDDPHEMFRDDPFFRFFFGPDQQRRQQQQRPREERREQSGGSGFFVSPDGYILTNNHVVADATKVEVALNDGTRLNAEIVGTDPNIDLALLKVDSKGRSLPTLALGDSDKLRPGQWVIAIGNPFELSETVTAGVISAKDRQVPIGDTDRSLVSFLQTDAAINFGNSGGPLLDASGRVVGINTAINRGGMAEGIGFALPINQARSAMDQLRATGKVRRGYIGVSMTDINDAMREYLGLPDKGGVYVQTVTSDGPAEKAGIQPDDVIRKVAGETIKNGRDLLGRVASRKPGDRIDLEVLRGRKPMQFTLTLAERPDAAELGQGDLRRKRGQGDEGEPEGSRSSEALGIKVETLNARAREELQLPEAVKGVLVTDVEVGSEASAAGLRAGMVVTAVNDAAVTGISTWKEAVGRLTPGTVGKLKITVGKNVSTLFMRVPAAGKN